MVSSIESISISAMIVCGMTVLLVISGQFMSDKSILEANSAVRKIARLVNLVGGQDIGARSTIYIHLPGNLASSKVEGNEIGFVSDKFTPSTDIYSTTRTKVTGALPHSKGSYIIIAEKIGDNLVEVYHG